jgi:hypothetical protein
MLNEIEINTESLQMMVEKRVEAAAKDEHANWHLINRVTNRLEAQAKQLVQQLIDAEPILLGKANNDDWQVRSCVSCDAVFAPDAANQELCVSCGIKLPVDKWETVCSACPAVIDDHHVIVGNRMLCPACWASHVATMDARQPIRCAQCSVDGFNGLCVKCADLNILDEDTRELTRIAGEMASAFGV